jgi:hypothetical protein
MSINHSLTPKPTKMTKETIKKETTKIIKRIEALESAAAFTDFDPIIGTMLKEYKDRYEYLIGSKEFMVHFEGGGWNTCYGITQEDAFDNAVLEYGGSEYTQVNSVSLSSPEGIKAAMSLFY